MPHPVLAELLLSRGILVTGTGCALGGAPRSGVTRPAVNFAHALCAFAIDQLDYDFAGVAGRRG